MKFSPERFIQNVVPDLRDNLKSDEPPPAVSETIENASEAAPLVERLLSTEMRHQLEAAADHLPIGESRARVAVGSGEEGTRHPHDYIIDKNNDGLVLYFIDPEHQMGMSKNKSALSLPRRGDIRPKISTLIGVRMNKTTPLPDISMIRYRAAAIDDPRLLKLPSQFEIAKTLLGTGEIPELLAGRENEITFRLNVRSNQLLVQSRYANEEDLKRFLHGEKSASVLEGKVHSYNVIMRHFLHHLKDGRFKLPEEGSHLESAHP